MLEEPRDELDPALRRARYGKHDDGDRFLGFWLTLLVHSRQQRLTPSLTHVRRAVESFYAGRDVRAAIAAVGLPVVQDQLRDAAAVYFQTCLTDPQYSSVVFGMNRLQPDQLRTKAAKETATLLAAVVECRAGGPAGALPALLVDGFLEVFGDPGRNPLRNAVMTKTSLAHLGLV